MCRFEERSLLISGPENISHRRLTERLMRRKLHAQFRKATREPVPIMHREPVGFRPPRLDHLHHSIAVPVAVGQSIRLRLMQLINRIAPPVAAGQVHPPVAVEVARRHTRPPTLRVSESPCGRHILEAPALIAKHAHRPPFHRQREVRNTVSVQIREGRAADHAEGFERFTQRTAGHQLATFIQPDRGGDRLRVAAWPKASAHEQIQIAVAVDVRGGHRTHACGACWQALRRGKIRGGIDREFGFPFGAQLVVRRRDEQTAMAQAVRPSQRRSLIAGRDGSAFDLTKSAALLIAIGCQRTAAARRHDQIFPAICIEIIPTDSRPQAAQAARQHRLSRPIIERFVHMRVANQRTDILEHRSR